MEQLNVFDCSNTLIACYFTDNKHCVHANKDHTLVYICSGELEIEENGRKTLLRPGDCAFMRRDNRLIMSKHADEQHPYKSIMLKFSRSFLREFYQAIAKDDLPAQSKRAKDSLVVLPNNRPDIRGLFNSVIPYFDAATKPSEEILKLKMTEGLYVLLSTDENLYASLFDFVDPWKIDIIDYLEQNYMNELSMQQIAYYTGRSLSTFKRDFAKVSNLTPEKWIIRRRLEAAHELIQQGKRRVTDVCFDVGFKNLSHFSKLYKETYGYAPSAA